MKSRLFIYKVALTMLLALCIGFSLKAQFKVVGYAPSWAQTSIQYSKLTHINYAFALPQYGGRLKAIDNPGYLQTIVANAHANGVKVFVAIGGWSDNGTPLDPIFESIGGDPGSRTNLINDAIYLINTYNLDGIDIDWEYPDPGNSANNYTTLLREMSTALHARGKGLSIAAAADSYSASGINGDVFQYVDFVNIMAYDDGSSANHSTYQYAVNGVNLFKGKGCPANKCIVGVPFYARPSWRSYADLLAAGADPNSDFFGSDGYNGIPTIKQKTQMAISQAGGIMMWELAQDAQGAYSLLSAINDVVKSSNNNNNNNNSGVATFYKDCNYGGYAVSLPAGDYNLSDLQAKGILNDDISSLKINSGYEVQLFWDMNFSGSSLVVGSDNSCLVNNGWNDQASSLKVRAKTSSFSTTIQAESYGAMNGVQTEATTDAGGGLNVGYIDAGDWMAYYNITFPTSGTYTVQYRVASVSGGTLSMDLNAGSIQLGAANIPATGGWQNWTTITQTVTINAGTYNVGIYAQTGGWNINWFTISKNTGAKIGASDQQDLSSITSNYNLAGNFQLAPNPVLNELNLQASFDTEGGKVLIVDAMGIEVYNGTAENNSINVSTLSSGIYTLIYSKDGNKIVKRFVKQ
ncbi:MAG TPA: glycosyl hydrolase family 18 protein [Cytophagaceae bacterium]|nr:glycosyl hydrolase family 18 protein [Cytophagaceae bacterium]